MSEDRFCEGNRGGTKCGLRWGTESDLCVLISDLCVTYGHAGRSPTARERGRFHGKAVEAGTFGAGGFAPYPLLLPGSVGRRRLGAGAGFHSQPSSEAAGKSHLSIL